MRPIYDITPFTLLDYPEKPACIAWMVGCNLRCKYCYNPDIVLEYGNVTEEEFLTFLDRRIGRLEGVVFSGGECTKYAGLPKLIEKVKEKGFLVKIDTNGTNPKMMKKLLDANLINYVALDFKGSQKTFKNVTGKDFYTKFIETLSLLKQQNKVQFEVRTTVHTDLLSEEDIVEMSEVLKGEGYKGTYYLQSYQHKENLGRMDVPSYQLNRDSLSEKAALPIEWRDA